MGVIWRVRVRHQAKTGIKLRGSKVFILPKTAEIPKKPFRGKSEVVGFSIWRQAESREQRKGIWEDSWAS